MDNTVKNRECSRSEPCGVGYTCVRARRARNLMGKLSRKRIPKNCRRFDANGIKKNTGCCKKKYSPMLYKRVGIKKNKIASEDFSNVPIEGAQQNNTGDSTRRLTSTLPNINTRPLSRNKTRTRRIRIRSSTRRISRNKTRTRSSTRPLSRNKTRTRILRKKSRTQGATRRALSEYPNTNTTRPLSRNRTNEITREPKSSPTRNQTRIERSGSLKTIPDIGLELPETQPLSAEEQSKAEASNFQRFLKKAERFFQTKRNRQRAAINERLAELENTPEVEEMLREVGNKGKYEGERLTEYGRFYLEGVDKEFEKCGAHDGIWHNCMATEYPICAKARRIFQNSLKRKYLRKYPTFENCLPYTQELGKKKKKHRRSGCCISKETYGHRFKFKKIN